MNNLGFFTSRFGSTTAVFSLVNQVLLRPLPYAEADRLVYLWSQTRDGRRDDFSGPVYHDLLEQSRSFESLASAAGIGSATITGHGTPERIRRLMRLAVRPKPVRTPDEVHLTRWR